MIAQATKRGVRIECATCGRTKNPIGRSAPMGSYMCDWECSGYRLPPHVGSLWPGETDVDFGYPCSNDGTEPWAPHHGPEHVAIDRCRWQEDSALLLLTDGSEMSIYVVEHARGELRLDFEALVEPGLELRTWRTAAPWVAAHADVLLAEWNERCLEEREERAIDSFDNSQVEYWR